ncbi:hypothetical protein AMIS_74130 [Actinoplanes missouriensis 431]|uniref:Uncharacterized protein n=1 Tax=Actinoplanes missouriensis (strain ATCC 14538 / DSM 43046 / CBS 188.64 / JCM 3121 / NBRC 102363 / NCIMB 12654 / NRRL B-3342 / UNCC 431) TaxID=512565 RepID=I0HHZ6_ACTM4|nr:hypothetical protein [Actinoplanes missouriensis]BAL92633.1 hypothetical protein AMIS_74130 [Actinoplanes missouriensis 431]
MSLRTIRRHSWPLDAEAATELLQADLPGWVVTYRPGLPGIFWAERLRETGSSAVWCSDPAGVYATIENLCDEDTR